MSHKIIKVNDDFEEIGTRNIDNRKRLTVGELAEGFNRVKVYKNKLGEILIRPVVEIPASEYWLFKDKAALGNVKKGIEDVKEGKITKIDPDSL